MTRGSRALVIGGVVALIVGVVGALSSLGSTPPQLVSLAKASPSQLSKPQALPASRGSDGPSPSAAALASRVGPATTAGGAPIARLSISRLGIDDAPIYDRGVDPRGVMVIAPGYAVTHYSFSAPFGAGNAVIYGHDDIQGSIFGHLYDLAPGDLVQVVVGGRRQTYRVTGHQIVAPTAIGVLAPTSGARLTIITCWPFNVDSKRWIVTAMLL